MAKAAKLIAHTNGKIGGYLVGRKHSENGIKAVNVDTNQPIEMEADEVVITAAAVQDPKLHDFDGEMLTNLQILSRINVSGKGVSFLEEGGYIGGDLKVRCCGNKHTYNGVSLIDNDIIEEMAKGAHVCGCEDLPHKPSNRHLPSSYRHGGKIPDILTDLEKQVIDHFKSAPGSTYISLFGHDRDEITNLLKDNLIFATGMLNSGHIDVFITDTGRRLLTPLRAGEGLKLDIPAVPLILKKGDLIEKQVYKGVKGKYSNPYEINRAIEELLDAEPAPFTDFSSEEKQFFGYYTGYGGLEKFGATGAGLLYEYYTPALIAEKMWGLAYKYGYKGGSVLEPACGIGEFFKFMPPGEIGHGYEINPYSARIAAILYPEVRIKQEYFEQLFIKGRDTIKGKIEMARQYSLVIGNPPYGKFEGKYAGMGEKSYTKAGNYIDYFIFRGLDLLERGGLLIFIVGAEVAAGGLPFLAQAMNPVKREIANKSTLLTAYRLPNGVFERTDVLTDIIVLQKK